MPDIQPRRLPSIEKNPGHFGAFYTKLKYYPGWDNLWPVDQDPDIVVCFDHNPSKLIFWRGARYGPAWVSENENWMADQSLETWGNGANDIEGCFEHMQDRHCRFSHVRIIENNEARAVVHWRYALVSSHDHTWMPDPKTGWECWVDEYYYVYPDGSAIRKVSWNQGDNRQRHPVPGIHSLSPSRASAAKISSKTTMCLSRIMITTSELFPWTFGSSLPTGPGNIHDPAISIQIAK